jgi:dUTPase
MIQAFRREKNDQREMNLILRGLDATANYRISGADAKEMNVASGDALMKTGLHVEIPEPRGAVLLFYKKIH